MHRPGRVEADVRVNRDYAAVAASTYAVRSGLFAGNGFEPPVPLRMSSAAACLPKVAATLKATTGWVSRLGAKVPTCWRGGALRERGKRVFFHRTRSRA